MFFFLNQSLFLGYFLCFLQCFLYLLIGKAKPIATFIYPMVYILFKPLASIINQLLLVFVVLPPLPQYPHVMQVHACPYHSVEDAEYNHG